MGDPCRKSAADRVLLGREPLSRGVVMAGLAELIRQAGRTAVFTGAGVSTLSGIPDFRGPQGLYKRIDADRIFSLAEFQADPGFFYASAADFLYEGNTRQSMPAGSSNRPISLAPDTSRTLARRRDSASDRAIRILRRM